MYMYRCTCACTCICTCISVHTHTRTFSLLCYFLSQSPSPSLSVASFWFILPRCRLSSVPLSLHASLHSTTPSLPTSLLSFSFLHPPPSFLPISLSHPPSFSSLPSPLSHTTSLLPCLPPSLLPSPPDSSDAEEGEGELVEGERREDGMVALRKKMKELSAAHDMVVKNR